MQSILVAASALVIFCNAAANAQESQEPGPLLSVPREDSRAVPQSAEAALRQAESAYEYGDMPLLVESARGVTDGTLSATPAQLAEALRFLGIGLYVTGRVEGARTAFEKLLQLEPKTELNPATTRPEIVGFFFDLRRARIRELRAAHAATLPNILWNFIPPMGQFNNGDRVKGWILLVGQVVTGATAATAYVMFKGRQRSNDTCVRPDPKCPDLYDTAETLRDINIVAGAAFLAFYGYGVIDGLMVRGKSRSEEDLLRSAPPQVSVSLLPNGAALNVVF